ncbi:hypothetical protein LA080_002906 [Diaporthe eres]|nr:hypothetical protein LA080_002906 [Diaporthe eres]
MAMASHRRLLQPLGRWPLVVAILMVGLFLYLQIDRLTRNARVSLEQTVPSVTDTVTPGAKGILPETTIAAYMRAILDSNSEHLPKVDCHNPDLSRYKDLKPSFFTPGSQTPYFFALNLRESLHILPTLLSSVVAAINFLGPENCALSIVEGNSPDGTADVLAALEAYLKPLKVRTNFVLLVDDIDPSTDARFARLATLRNMALQPLVDEPERYRDATVLFINDVAACPDDLLELVYQRKVLSADMTCAMDWIFGAGDETLFYDSYIARGINGDLFFEIPPGTGSFAKATNLFWNDPESKARFEAGRPLQVFACWNGAVAFPARPIAGREVAFRAARAELGECHNGEPEIFCKDLWAHGYGRIAVVPYINLEYSTEKGQRIKDERGYTSATAASKPRQDSIDWQGPPEEVKSRGIKDTSRQPDTMVAVLSGEGDDGCASVL